MPIRPALAADEPAVRRLLGAGGLSASDLGANDVASFLVAESSGGVDAVVALQVEGEVGLLRSLAVTESARRRALGRELVVAAERRAVASGVKQVCLLTTDAADYFERLGYRRLERSAAPAFIRGTAQFRGLCPASATLMEKWL